MTNVSTDTEHNKAVVRRFYEPFRTGDTSSFRDILAPEWVNHPAEPGTTPGPAGAPPVGYYRQVLSDLVTTTEAMIAEGDLVAVRTTHRGTHSAEFLGIPATGRRIELPTQDMHRLAAGRIVETWHLEDFAGLRQQLTAPSPARPTSELNAEAVAFLSAGARTGKIGWTAADGRPLMAPVWFVVEDGELVFNTEKDSAKGRALQRDPRLVLCVDLEEPPYAFVQVQGTATVSEDAGELLRTATAVASRYVGAGRAEEFGRRNGAPGSLVVRVRPTKVVAVYDLTA